MTNRSRRQAQSGWDRQHVRAPVRGINKRPLLALSG